MYMYNHVCLNVHNLVCALIVNMNAKIVIIYTFIVNIAKYTY